MIRISKLRNISKRQNTFRILFLVLFFPFGESLIGEYDEAFLRAVLEEEVPEVSVHSLKLVSNGWNNLVADVNDEWIFRFPRTDEYASVLKREHLLLESLQDKISLPIPYYQYTGLHTSFVGYRKILGCPLSEELYTQLPNPVRQSIAETLALFLTQLHHAVNIEQALQWGYEKYHISLPWIEHELLGTLPSPALEKMVSEALTYAKHNPYHPENLFLLHDDLHGENMAFDTVTNQVTGVFDFSDAVIGDYSIEFGKLFDIHCDLVIRTSEAYASLTGLKNPLIPAAVDFILRRALYILHSRESHGLDEPRLLRLLERFIPVWNELHRLVGEEAACLHLPHVGVVAVFR